MIRLLDLNEIEIVRDILELQKASYIIEAELINFYDIPPLKDTIEAIKKCDEIFYGYYINESLAGIISYKISDKVLDIHRVAIHPRFFRLGVAGKLIAFIENLQLDINNIEVCTGKMNTPAVNLYLKNGYKEVKDIEIGEGIYLTLFKKEI
jgi:ribosomal protein S18 acetylase RimI-like enzyme